MTQIHPSAIVDSQAELAEDVVVGPFCLVGPKVCIGVGTVLRSHVVVEGSTTIGARNVIYAGASIGCHPQDKKYRGEDTRLVVGDRHYSGSGLNDGRQPQSLYGQCPCGARLSGRQRRDFGQ